MQKGFQQLERFTIIATVLAGLAVVSFCLGSCSRGGHSGKMESIAIGMEPNVVNSLIYIATDEAIYPLFPLVIFKSHHVLFLLTCRCNLQIPIDRKSKYPCQRAPAKSFLPVTKKIYTGGPIIEDLSAAIILSTYG